MILNKIKKFIIENNLIVENDKIICALSSGIDSTFMFIILYKLLNEINFKLSACHVNHLLRGKNSYEDLFFVQTLCNNHKIHLDFITVNTIDFCKKKYSIELGARKIRYAFFDNLLKKYINCKIATAHNYNDNVETIILNLLRGSDTLRGIPLLRDKIIRPILNISRYDIINYLQNNNIKYRHDLSNKNNIFNRNKIRNLVFPIFDKINNKYYENITNTYNLLKQEDKYLNKISYQLMKKIIYFDNDILKIKINEIIKIEYFLLRRVLILAMNLYTKITYINLHVKNIIKIIFSSNPSANIYIENYYVNRMYNWVYIYQKKEKPIINKLIFDFLKSNGEYNNIIIIDKQLYIDISINDNINIKKCMNKNNSIFYLDYEKIDIPTFHLRTRLVNDKIYLDDNCGYRKLKNIYINNKIPKIYRDLIPLLVDKNNIICCLFVGINQNYQVNHNTKKILTIKFRSLNLYEGMFNR